jgi:uncharacterized protein (TIGR02231 family)
MRILVLSMMACLVSASAGAAALEARNARMTEVTVYPDRAEVVREATVEVPAGASTIEFKDVPFAADPSSLRVSAKGVETVLGAVVIRERADTPKETPELVALRDEVKRLEGELAKVASQDRVAADLREFLKSLRATTAQRESENIGSGRVDPAGIAAVYDLLAKRLGDLGDDELARREQAVKLAKDLELARAKLAATPAAGSIRSRVAEAEIEARQAGTLTLRLAYLVAGASWAPAYRATLDPVTGEVALVSEGVVRQRTGEDWKGVALKLSTAAPALGVAPPEMASLLLRPRTEGVVGGVVGGVESDRFRELPVAGRYYQNVLDLAPGAQDRMADRVPAAPLEAQVVHSAYNVAFEVPGRSDVPADSGDHRVVLRQEDLTGTLTYRAAPALEPAAFLTSIVRAPAQYPLLSGTMRVLAGGAYLGVYSIPETPAGAELTVPFGRDNRVKIDRVRQPQDRSLEGLTGKTKQIAYEFRTSVENLRDQPVTMILEDRVPVSEDERIVVEMGKGTTPDHTPSKTRPGVLLWKLTLAPREKKNVVLAYTVRHPKDLGVPGLE